MSDLMVDAIEKRDTAVERISKHVPRGRNTDTAVQRLSESVPRGYTKARGPNTEATQRWTRRRARARSRAIVVGWVCRGGAECLSTRKYLKSNKSNKII